MIKAAVFAGDYNQYQNYVRESAYKPGEVKFITSRQDILPLKGDIEIVMYGTYYERDSDYTKLADELTERLRDGVSEEVGEIVDEDIDHDTPTPEVTQTTDEPVVEGGIRYFKEGDLWCAVHDASFVSVQVSKVGRGETKEAALENFQRAARNG